jgi:uncharacterized RDD family membrane protein YckC
VIGAPAAEPDRQGYYAGFVSRFVAWVADLGVSSGVFMLALAAASFAASVVTGNSIHWSRDNWVVIGIFAAWEFVYYAYSWAANGKTFGAALLGVQVVSTDGGAAGPRRAIVRTLAFPLSFLLLGLGFLGILVGRERRALHDVIAGTTVVYAWSARSAHLKFLSRDALPGGDPPHQLGYDPRREARLGGRGVVLAPRHHRAGEREHGDLDVGVRAEFAGGDAAAEH